MHSMGVQAVLVVFLLLPATVKSDGGGVTFWRQTVKLTCPQAGNWFDKNGKIEKESPQEAHTFKYNGKGKYSCEYLDGEDKKYIYHFYVEGKACEDCFELDAALFLVVIVADVVGTAVVMVIICRCTKKKRSAGTTQSSKAPARSEDWASPVPSQTYQPLTPHTRSQETYSVVNRTG